jgi:formylmethanofuran dehydrogenase subunit C
MKKIGLSILSFLLTVTALASNFDLKMDAFTTAEVSGNYKVKFVQADAPSIKVVNKDDELDDDRIIAEVSGSELTIRIKADTYVKRDLEITVYYTKLWSLTAKRGCEVVVKDRLMGDMITIQSESGGKIDVKAEATNLTASVSAGGSISIDGKADVAEFSVSAGGTIGAIDVIAGKVVATVKAGGEIICAADTDLSIKIVSGGSVSYKGNPAKFEQDITLGGKITKL